MMYSIAFKANDKTNLILFGSISIIAMGLTVWGIILNYYKYGNLKRNVALYFGISTIAYSCGFFWMYYEILYKIADVDNPIYMILGLVGYIAFAWFVLYYRYKVHKGVYKNKAGVPKYSVIIFVTIFGSIVTRGYFEKLNEGIKPFIMAVIALLISYVFSVGVAQLFEFWRISKSGKRS